jgi:hypothetical protein
MSSFVPDDRTFIAVPDGVGKNFKTADTYVTLDEHTWVVRIPARIGLSVKDMSTFAPGKSGGGGIGPSVELYSSTVCFEIILDCTKLSVAGH